MNFTCGCLYKKQTEPHFKKSKHFEDLSASFAINAKNEKLGAHYSWLVQMHKLVNTKEPYIEATFDNPSDRSRPIIVPAIKVENQDIENKFQYPRYYVLSPNIDNLDCGLYKMKLTAYSDKSKSKVLAEHENEILSRINTTECTKTEFMEKMSAAARQVEQEEWEKVQ